MARPDLSNVTCGAVFRDHYYLLSELRDCCRARGLPVSGTKEELTGRIARYLDTGEVGGASQRRPKATRTEPITPGSILEENMVCSQAHRAFFRDAIGKRFVFTVAFQQWLRENAGKTYRDAIAAYQTIEAGRKTRQTEIAKQFEYNTYIRAFFADRPGLSLQDAIRCWRHKKGLPGPHRYERSDLKILE